ncbi:hypothetical protein GIB67_018947 [Kingdonia uniflora]|uniref:Uncharacterized protein n=1 Tax=Kingdonia uniflora TaxID=39325 RepID=A0A7J7L2Y2_9MAGN|nr:hypothetical protein GIB67_018947 [Kingdonia uniflora]
MFLKKRNVLETLGIIIRALSSGHIPPVNFILVTMGSTSIFLIGWRALFVTVLPSDDSKKNDVYKRGSPFELFERAASHGRINFLLSR